MKSAVALKCFLKCKDDGEESKTIESRVAQNCRDVAHRCPLANVGKRRENKSG